MHVHNLAGCAPTPLAHYLKALGILRLVSEQIDPHARGWWDGDRFRLATGFDRVGLERFFLHNYEPTPLVSPWNRGSGFFYENDAGLTPLANSTAPRFERVRAGIKASWALLDSLAKADKDVRAIKEEAKSKHLSKAERERMRLSMDYRKRLADAERRFKVLKTDLIPRCRASWRGPHREWLDAAVVLEDDGTQRFPALLGTGGSDGRLDFTNNFMQRLAEVFDVADSQGKPSARAERWICAALWGEATRGYQDGSPVGQYLPGGAGGANSSNGPEGGAFLNPVDFLLMLEGTVLFTAHATRRLGAYRASRAAAPFAVSAQGAGYISAGESDESPRGEQWMPLWTQPLALAELRRLLGEGRAQIGARAIREPLDLARAVARMGTARGISSFQRYGYIERNGQSNLAVPLGRFRVPDRIEPQLVCLDDLDPWLPRLRREARAATAPARLRHAERRLGDALFAVTQHPREAARWQAVLQRLAAVEAVMVTGSGYRAGPIPTLRSEWVMAAHDGADPASARELRLALSLALQRWRDSASYTDPPIPDTVRRHWLPLRETRSWHAFATSGTGSQTRLEVRPDVVMTGRSGEDDAVALLTRRLIEASQRGERRLPLVAARGAAAHRSDLAALLGHQVSLDRTLGLARALMALDSYQWVRQSPTVTPAADDDWPDDAWMTIRVALLPWPVDDRGIGTNPAILRRLAVGDAASAFDLALRRLQAAGIRSSVRMAPAHADARLWAAALAFPISKRIAARFIERLSPSNSPSHKEPPS